MANKKKVTTAVVAVATAAAILLGGTFAWQSINQTALNEASDVINPGGRLHDDFNGSNKDVYVENFAENEIFARIRLDEYFAVTMNKGTNGEIYKEIAGTMDTKTEEITEWATHYFDAENATDEYWDWQTGGSTVFMPTFNKNKDSLEADVNGTYNGQDGVVTDEATDDRYTDYVEYTYGETKTDDAVYDIDSNMDEDDGVNYVSEEHTATNTLGAQLISMEDWKALSEDDQIGEYWVYDTDGWVYWAAPIAQGEATGLLLDGISLDEKMDDSWYYAINVVAQFVTADDVGKSDGTGFYDTQSGTAPSANAEILLEKIGVDMSGEAADGGENEDEDDGWYSDANITVNGQEANESGYIYLTGLDVEKNNSFSVVVNENAVTLAENGLTAKLDDSNIIGTEFTVDENDPYKATLTIAAHDNHTVKITAAYDDGTSETVTVVPIYSTIIITPDMDGETLYLNSDYYTLQAEKFTGTVIYEFSGANRSMQEERDGAQKLFISSYESGTDITLTASDGTDTATVNIIIVNNYPYDGPIYAYSAKGSGLVFANALVEGQDYYWNQSDSLSYELSVGMTNDFAGQVNITLEGLQTDADGNFVAGFISENGTFVNTASGQTPAGIRVTKAQTKPFTIKIDITGIDGTKYETTEYHHEIYIYPVPEEIDALRHISMRKEDYTDNLYIGPGESKEVSLHASYIYGITSTNPLSNDDLTWSISTEDGNYEITEGDGLSVTVAHLCTDVESCTCVDGGKVQAKFDGMDYNIVSDFILSPVSDDSGDSEEGGEESTLAMTFTSDLEYTDDGNGGAYIEIEKNRTEQIVWNLYGCSEGKFTLSSSNDSVTFEPYSEGDDNVDMNIVIPTTVTEDFTVTATAMNDSGKSVVFTVKMVDNE